MPIYNLIESSDNYSKLSGSLWKYYRDECALTNAGVIADFSAGDKRASFKFKQKITGVSAVGVTTIYNKEQLKSSLLMWIQACILS